MEYFEIIVKVIKWRLRVYYDAIPIIPIGTPRDFIYWPAPAQNGRQILRDQLAALSSYIGDNYKLINKNPWNNEVIRFSKMDRNNDGIIELGDGYQFDIRCPPADAMKPYDVNGYEGRGGYLKPIGEEQFFEEDIGQDINKYFDNLMEDQHNKEKHGTGL